jgi:RNA polymerase sigma-B factor
MTTTTATRDALIASHMPLARKLARRYARGPEQLEDLEQVAALGLVVSAGRFDASRGFAFSSFAVPTIAGEIKRYFRDAAWAVHVPRGLKDRGRRVQRAVDDLDGQLRRPPTVKEVADRLELTVDEVLEARIAYGSYVADSLDAPAPRADDGEPLGERLGAVDKGYDLAEMRVAIERALAQLPERERLAVSLRFHGGLPQTEIAERIGVSQMSVSRILARSLEVMRTALEF